MSTFSKKVLYRDFAQFAVDGLGETGEEVRKPCLSSSYRSLVRIPWLKLLYQVVQLIDAGPTYSGRQSYRLRVFDVLNQSPSPEESQSEFGTTGAQCSAQEWCK